MRKLKYSLLLGLLLFSLSGCTTNSIGTGQPPVSGTITENSNNLAMSDTTSSADDLIPSATPTPEGNFIEFSLKSGFYEKSQQVALSCNVEGATIYYTLDGSTPDNTSTEYKNPINVTRKLYTENVLAAQTGISPGNSYVPNFPVDKGTVIRAIGYLPDGTTTPISHATYFIELDRAKYAGVPVVSLITDFENLFDYETGIYVLGKTYDDFVSDPANAALESWQMQGNYTNRGREWERPVSVELIPADDTEGFKQDMGMRIMGASTRNQAQKSIRIYAREDYGKKNLKYELIPGNLRSDGTDVVDKYKSFVLRIGGNDADFGRLRDPFLQNLVQNARFETQQNTPCVVFINGEYWGMYTITEDYSDNYFENNYGIDNKNIVLIKKGEVEDGEDADIELFHDMYHYITQNDMSVSENYKKACELLDIGSFADAFAFNLYIYNKDSLFDNNNWRIWRVRTADMATPWSDGKWRFAVYDTDFSTGIYDGAGSAEHDNITEKLHAASDEEYQQNLEDFAPIELFRSLLKNETFKEEFLLALCDMRNIYLEPKHAKAVLDEMAVTYQALMPDTFLRFGPDWIAMFPEWHYESKLKDLSSFVSKRYLVMPDMVGDIFNLGTQVKLKISTKDTISGTIEVNGRPVDSDFAFSGIYYNGNTVTVTAVPAEGYKFAGWEVKSGTFTDTASETFSLTMTEDLTLTAIFEKK